MPPKHKVSREEILAAAWSLLEEKGHTAVTTRAIAEKLGLSSRPVYSFFDSMEEILSELDAMAGTILREYMQRPYTQDPFLNMGVGYVCFCQEKPHVSNFLELRLPREKILIADRKMFSAFYERFRKSDGYNEIPEDDFFEIYTKISVYTYGLVTILKASSKAMSVPEIIENVHDTGEALFVHYFWKKKEKSVAAK